MLASYIWRSKIIGRAPTAIALSRSRAPILTDGRQKNTFVDLEERTLPVAAWERSEINMSTTAEQVVMDALALPTSLRAFVAEKLIESLDVSDSPPLSPEWRQEVRRRCAEMDRGDAELRDADQVFARAFAALV